MQGAEIWWTGQVCAPRGESSSTEWATQPQPHAGLHARPPGRAPLFKLMADGYESRVAEEQAAKEQFYKEVGRQRLAIWCS